MEDILASIKRIIDEDGASTPSPRARRSAGDPHAETPPTAEPEVLELTQPAPLVSQGAASASRHSLDVLSAMVVRSAPNRDNTLESLVRELLRPLLKEWLDTHLPELVEILVAREISRITDKGL